jgi:hypothetical protein
MYVLAGQYPPSAGGPAYPPGGPPRPEGYGPPQGYPGYPPRGWGAGPQYEGGPPPPDPMYGRGGGGWPGPGGPSPYPPRPPPTAPAYPPGAAPPTSSGGSPGPTPPPPAAQAPTPPFDYQVSGRVVAFFKFLSRVCFSLLTHLLHACFLHAFVSCSVLPGIVRNDRYCIFSSNSHPLPPLPPTHTLHWNVSLSRPELAFFTPLKGQTREIFSLI